MKNILLLIGVLLAYACEPAFAQVPRVIDADGFKRVTSGSAVLMLPTTSGTVVCDTCVQTILNKTVSGAAIIGGSVSGAAITNSNFSDILITNPTITGGSVSGAAITASGSILTNPTITGGSVSGASVIQGTVSGTTIYNATIIGGSVSGVTGLTTKEYVYASAQGSTWVSTANVWVKIPLSLSTSASGVSYPFTSNCLTIQSTGTQPYRIYIEAEWQGVNSDAMNLAYTINGGAQIFDATNMMASANAGGSYEQRNRIYVANLTFGDVICAYSRTNVSRNVGQGRMELWQLN